MSTAAGTLVPPGGQALAQPRQAGQEGLLINVDNGGTLTDLCVIDGSRVYRTKTITTPYDLSKCLFEGLRKASRAIYGREDVQSLLLATQYIRYSTTQGTNALVERKGPRLGIILGGTLTAAALQADAQQVSLFAGLVRERSQVLPGGLPDEVLESAAVRAVNALASAGANRIVVAFGGAGRDSSETRLKRVLLRKFPPHLLGAIPILYSHELVEDADDVRRAWTALFNAFLHPAMERFLYSAEHKLRDYRTRNPLLIFRNDGQSARVAKTAAIKTYSSGPRGGAEGARALAQHYGFKRLLSMDVGGTTTDISLVENGAVRTERHGRVEGVITSLPLCDVVSVGVGGSSICKVVDGAIRVGPESVGGAPGPACFGLGGRQATATDAFLALGLLDPASFFGGELKIDLERARAALDENIGKPLGIPVEQAAQRVVEAWSAKIADSLRHFTTITKDTTLAAFGGAGPFVVCKVAEAAGISTVVIPGLAAVFSAFGIGFSDIGHQYEAALATNDADGLEQCRRLLAARAARGMFAEGAELDRCVVETTLRIERDGREESVRLSPDGGLPADLPAGAHLSLALTAVKPIAHASLSGRFGQSLPAARSTASRRTLVDGEWRELPLYRVEDQAGGAAAAGPAVLEEAFFTCRVDHGWRLEINQAGDILLTRG